MLEPQSRAALTELLKPPAGFELEYAVGTTFTLDLSTALMVPLSFASHRVTVSDEKLGVLEAVRRASNRIDIFAQSGHLSMGIRSDLVAFLEPMVHPVVKANGLFHPKVWVLKYRSGERVTHRLLCGSRNLTEDKSWDVIVCLDERTSSKTTVGAGAEINAPLVSFIRALPAMAVQPLDNRRLNRLMTFAEQLGSIEWELPEGAHSLAFHALGIGENNAPRPTFDGLRALVISPFVSEKGLSELRGGISEHTYLLSREETLDKLPPAAFDDRLRTYVLDNAASLEIAVDEDDLEGTSAGDTGNTTISVNKVNNHLSGLHAKVISVDRPHRSHLFLGSANATDAALFRNVEMMIEIEGKTGLYGVESVFNSLGDLKDEYETQGGAEPDPTEQVARNLEARLRDLGGMRVNVKVVEADPYDLHIWVDTDHANLLTQVRDDGIDLRWQLLTRIDLGSTRLGVGERDAVLLDGVDLVDITPFLVLIGSVTAPDGTLCERRTILLARIQGDVPNRRDAIIASKLTDKAAFMRLLTLMLELSGVSIASAGGVESHSFFGGITLGGVEEGSGLFEALMKAVASRHEGLNEVKRIIDFLRAQGDEHSVLPDGFDGLWNQVWQAYLEHTGGKP